MPRIAKVTLRTTTPCCRRRVTLVALVDVPKEVYDRACSKCGAEYTVERRLSKVTSAARVDILEWERIK